jgi:hypothetical protein
LGQTQQVIVPTIDTDYAYHANMREFNALVDQFKTTTDTETRFRILRRQEQLIEELEPLL